jgi:hypothetical protein
MRWNGGEELMRSGFNPTCRRSIKCLDETAEGWTIDEALYLSETFGPRFPPLRLFGRLPSSASHCQ